MNDVYKEARKGAVTLTHTSGLTRRQGSGFIYDDSTVITAGHVADKKGAKWNIETIDGYSYKGTVEKTQYTLESCDIAIIKTDAPGALRKHKKLRIGDPSSLKCGDPVVQIGSGVFYNEAGLLQGVGAAYQTTNEYDSHFFSPSGSPGMSGGPIVDREGEVITLSSEASGAPKDKSVRPGPLFIHTRLPVYLEHDTSRGPNSETMKRFIEDPDFYCPAVE